MIYAEAAHWANGEYAATTAAYFSDIDNDGYDEVVMHNDRLFAVFEGIGGRCTHLFVKGAGLRRHRHRRGQRLLVRHRRPTTTTPTTSAPSATWRPTTSTRPTR